MYHQNISSILGLCFLLITFAPAKENGSGLTYGVEMDFCSRYVWHGIPWSDGAVKQTSVWFVYRDLTVTFWDNYVLHNEPNHLQVNEFDLTVRYTKELGQFTLEPSFNYYWYPNQEASPSTGELAMKFAYALDLVEFFSNHNVDVKEYHGAYFGDIGLAYSREINPIATFESSLSLGWGSSRFNETYVGLRKSALNVIQAELAVSYTPKHCIYFRPHLAVSRILDGALADQLKDTTLVYGGIAIGKEF
ncbi:MAG: hypothetical protein N3A72_00955 [bacterium]|nr:hypothetical protein [bacterium]